MAKVRVIDLWTERVMRQVAAYLRSAFQFGNVDAGNYSEFETDGTLKFNGAATTWNDVLPSSITVAPTGPASPSFTSYNGGLKAYEFLGSGAQLKELNMGFQLSHNYKEGSDITPHLHVRIPNDVDGGAIKFGCEYSWKNVDEAEGVTSTVFATHVVAANAPANSNVIISFGPLVGTGKHISSIFMARIFRDPTDVADTFGSSVWLKSADIHIEQDMVGSRNALTK